MKRKIKILIMFIFILMLIFPNVCFAEEKSADYQSQLGEYDLSSFDLLDDDTASLLEELGIDNFDYENISSISFKQIIDYISSVFSKNAQGPLRCCLILICFIILSSIVKSFDMHLSSDSVSDMYATVSNLVIAIFLVTQIYPSMKLACSAIKLCSDFTYAFFPAFCIICATSGAAMTSFSVNGSLLLF